MKHMCNAQKATDEVMAILDEKDTKKVHTAENWVAPLTKKSKSRAPLHLPFIIRASELTLT